MGLFTKKNIDIQDADYIDIDQKNTEEATTESEVEVTEASSLDSKEVVDIAPIEEKPAEPFAVNEEDLKLPENEVKEADYKEDKKTSADAVKVEEKSTDKPAGDELEEIDVKEQKFPYSKYELEQLYMEIGEGYCAMHGQNPEPELAEKVSIVNVIKQHISDMKTDIMKLASSPLAFLLILLLTASIVVPYLPDKDVKMLIPMIPMMIIDLSCMLLFVQGITKHMNGLGFSILNVVLTIFMILMYLPILIFFFLGLAMKINGGTDVSTTATYILIGCLIAAILNWLYWGGLKNVLNTSRIIVTGGLAKWKSSIFIKILLLAQCVVEGLFVVALLCFKTKVSDEILRFVSIFNQYLGVDSLTENVKKTLDTSAHINSYTLVSSVLSLAITFVVFLIICKVKEHYRPNTEA